MPVKSYHAPYLREALDSVLQQTSRAWRLIIVTEPGCEGDVRAMAAAYLQDSRIGLIVNNGRKLAGAFNTGMRSAQTEFIAILLGDDKWAPEAVEILTRQIDAHPQADFFHSSRRIINEHGEPISSVHLSRSEVRLEHFGRASPVKHLLCWRRSMALSFGGMDETLNSVGADDFDFPWLMAEHGALFHAIPECLYIYRDHRSSFRLTTHLPRTIHTREIRRIMRKHRVGPFTIERHVRSARRSYLRQCLYRSEWDRWLREKLFNRSPVPRREKYL